MSTPPLPQGYALDTGSAPVLPKGYALDATTPQLQQQPSVQWPIMQREGESYDDFMNRAIAAGKQMTPEQAKQAKWAVDPRNPETWKKVGVTLGSAALMGAAAPTLMLAPELASSAVGGGIPGAMAAGATGGATLTPVIQAVTGKNPLSKESLLETGESTLIGAATGGLFSAGGKLLSYGAGKASELWDIATGYRAALQKAQDAIDLAKASYPSGQAGEWAKTNDVLGVTQKAIRISSDATKSWGNAGRGLELEGLTAGQLQKMTPPQITQEIAPRLNAAGKAIDALGDKATAAGTKIDAQKAMLDFIKDRVKDPGLQDKALDIIHEHAAELGIYDTGKVTPSEALQLRRALQNDANFNSQDFNSVRGVGKGLYRAVTGALHDAVPDLEALDMHYGDLKSAQLAAQKQTGKYLVGDWTPPQTRLQKAEALLPDKEELDRLLSAKIGARAGLATLGIGAGGVMGYGLRELLSNRSTTP